MVLTIILTILKIIGIIFLIILGLVLAIILIILFVPIRYNAEGFYKENYKICAKVSWFMHILTCQVYAESDEKFHANAKLFGVTVFDNLKPRKKAKKNNEKKQSTSEIQAAQLKEPFKDENDFIENNAAFETDTSMKKIKAVETDNISTIKDKSNKSKFNVIKNFLQKIHRALLNIQYTIQRICVKTKEIIGNISYYIELLHKEQTIQAFMLCKKRLRKITHNLKPKSYNINLHIGMENPDTLGQILGIWGILYPLHQGNIKVNAEFDKQIFECNFFVKGRITIWTYLWTACVVIFDKNIKYLRKCLKWEEDENG